MSFNGQLRWRVDIIMLVFYNKTVLYNSYKIRYSITLEDFWFILGLSYDVISQHCNNI